MRATDDMTHRCVRRCQRGGGWSFTLRDAVARWFMADGTPCPLAVTVESIGGEVQRGCVAIVGGSRFEEKDKSESTETLGLGLLRFGG